MYLMIFIQCQKISNLIGVEFQTSKVNIAIICLSPVSILVPAVYYNGSHIPWFIFISKGLYFLCMMNCSQQLLHKSCILGDNILFHIYNDLTTFQCYRIQSMAYQSNDILCKNCFLNYFLNYFLSSLSIIYPYTCIIIQVPSVEDHVQECLKKISELKLEEVSDKDKTEFKKRKLIAEMQVMSSWLSFFPTRHPLFYNRALDLNKHALSCLQKKCAKLHVNDKYGIKQVLPADLSRPSVILTGQLNQHITDKLTFQSTVKLSCS